MSIKKIVLFCTLCALIVACNSNNKKTVQTSDATAERSVDDENNTSEGKKSTPTDKEKPHWSYQGETSPEHWATIEKDADCGGQYQSPINIITDDAKVDNNLKPLEVHYARQTHIHNAVNNGHSIRYNFDPGDYISYRGKKYNLKQIHFHGGSEHNINGIRYPMVIHMVHLNSENNFLVLAIMVKEGKANSAPFEFLEQHLPVKKGQKKVIDIAFDLNKNLPDSKGYYNYVGSLTMPPCTEGVNWFIFKDPISISVEQVKILQGLMPINNYRSEQPLHGRIVKQTTY